MPTACSDRHRLHLSKARVCSGHPCKRASVWLLLWCCWAPPAACRLPPAACRTLSAGMLFTISPAQNGMRILPKICPRCTACALAALGRRLPSARANPPQHRPSGASMPLC